jgi:hypothetical protein
MAASPKEGANIVEVYQDGSTGPRPMRDGG